MSWPSIDARFKPGQSGNPGGRPKGIRRAMLRAAKYCPEMIDTLRNIALDKSQLGAVRIAAAAIVLDRGCGKVRPAPEDEAQPTNGRTHVVVVKQVNGQETRRQLSELSDEELEQMAKQLPEETER